MEGDLKPKREGPLDEKVGSETDHIKNATVERPAMNRRASEWFGNDRNLTLSFENLTVQVPGVKRNCCSCVDNPIGYSLQEYMGMQIRERDPFYAIHEVSGLLSTGEMCLVLGSNDVSMSTVVRTLSGRLNDNDELFGTISLNGMPIGQSNQGWRRLTSYVSASDTTHSAVLTVEETLAFAVRCTSDGTLSEANIHAKVTELMELLGLGHVADTVVGDENLRGVSGGQKRRVTVGEMWTDPNMQFFCFEQITDGLSSSDSLTILKALKNGCKQGNVGGIVSLQQPSDEMVHLFDKLLILNDFGEQVYFGPVDRQLLREIFLEGDEGDTGSICDLVLRPKRAFDAKVADPAVEKYRSSKVHKDVLNGLASAQRSDLPVHARNVEDILPDRKYSSSRAHQFRILMERRKKLVLRNAVTYTRVGIAIVFGVIIGSLFSALNDDLLGALGSTGYLFLNCFLVLMLSAAVTIPSAFRERSALFKHRSAEFFSGRVAYLAQVVTDIPLSILEAVLLSSISYFWIGLREDVSAFFYFMFTLVALEFVGQALGRMLCALARKQVSANTLSSIVILIFGTVAGFMPEYSTIPTVLRWLSWVTPVSYAFEGIMINEFSGRTISALILGSGDGSVEVGSLDGDSWAAVFSVPRENYLSRDQLKIFNIFMLFIFAIVYDLVGFFFVERTRVWHHNEIRRVQSQVKSSNLSSGDEQRQHGRESEKASTQASGPERLTVRGLRYSVPVKKNERLSLQSLLGPVVVRLSGKNVPGVSKEKRITLLNGIDATFEKGKMTALLGTSGAGKTTLLDVIAGYKTSGEVEGEILIDGRPKDDSTWKSISGYAEQNDILNPYLSVLETIRFTASCRLSKEVDKEVEVDKVIKLMELQDWKHFVIGRELADEGIPKHVRKRLTIALQLVVRPKILFLDEPTTGLGSRAAALVIGAIRRSTDKMGLITLATIHQPSHHIWTMFDACTFLTKGGRLTYTGSIGTESKDVLSYFRSDGEELNEQSNPADFVLGKLAGQEPEKAEAQFHASETYKTLIAKMGKALVQGDDSASFSQGSRNNFCVEVGLLTKRHFLTQWRNPSYSFMRILASIFLSFYLGILFSGDKSGLQGAVFSIGAIFFLIFTLVIPMQASVVPLIEDRAVLFRENMSGMYSRFSYGVGLLLSDIPFHILNTFLMWVFFYFLVGFGTDGESMGYFLLMLFLANFVIMSISQLFAFVAPNEESSNGLSGLSVLLSVILMGFLITVNSMPSGWEWAYWANLFHYILQGLISNEMSDKTYQLDLSLSLGPMNGNGLTPGIMGTTNATLESTSNFVLFQDGVDIADPIPRQISSLLTLTAQTEGLGINPNAIGNGLIPWTRCMIENECFSPPVASSFMLCNIFRPIGQPVCKEEYDELLSNIDFEQILMCFPDGGGNGTDSNSTDPGGNSTDPGGNSTNPDGNSTDVFFMIEDNGIPVGYSEADFALLTENDQLDLILCLLSAILPLEGIKAILEIIEHLYGIVVFLLNVIENGIQIPGELILWFFGWAEFRPGEGVVAPWKWHYCMSAVLVFLVTIEVLKLVAVRFIVWTKR